MAKGLIHLSYEENFRELWNHSAWIKEGSGDLIDVNKYSKGGYKKDRGSLFSVLPGDRQEATSTNYML